jgi:endonuclease YncB( thermonuclease family)
MRVFVMTLRRSKFSLVAGAAILASPSALAQAAAPAASSPPAALSASPACTGTIHAAGEVASVIDGRSFRLADGREVRLAAIETSAIAGDDSAGIAAKTALEELALDRPVVLHLAAPAPDRYGRLLAYAFIATPAGENLIQRELVAGGHALVSPIGVAPPYRNFLHAAERAARGAQLGRWADPDHGVRPANDPAGVLAHQGRFAVVGGRVASVRESGGIVYVNFGRKWLEDFAVTILKRNERVFTGAGLAPNKFAGRRIEVRGWIERRNGPSIEVARPEQIEFAD